MTMVSCNGCRACCRNQAVLLFPGDEPNLDIFELRNAEVRGSMVTMLKNRPNGDCWHLGANGCTIYDRRPVMCAHYDCRKQFLVTPKTERRLLDTPEIWTAARKRLNTLDEADHAEIARRRALR